jgi:Mrp family chromosome partitioning ATPase/capsular polysaccharide biosynthesis protein
LTVVVNEAGKDPTLRDYVRVVLRRKWIVIGAALTLMVLALAYSYVKTPMYKASAQLVYEGQLNVADPLSTSGYVDPSQMQVELNSVASAIASPELINSARAELATGVTASSYSVSAASDAQSGQTNVSTVSITAVSPDARSAALVANAYALAFTAARKAREQARVRVAEDVIKRELMSFDTSAKRLTPDYLTLQQRLQDLQILEATVTGNFRVLVPATVPKEPFSPQPMRNGAMGLLAGLVIGVGLVLLLAQFDTRVQTANEVVAIFGTPLLGQIRKMPAKMLEQEPLVVLSDSHSPAAESIRKVRGNLEFANVDGDLKSFFITSCLQHEGKSLTVCNLALALAGSGNRVVLVDGDLRRPQVHRYMGLPNGAGVSTVLTGKTDLQRALHSRSLGPSLTRLTKAGDTGTIDRLDGSLHVLTSGPVSANAAEMIASKSFANMVVQLEALFDHVIIDAPALLAVGDTAAIARCVDGLLFLVDLTRAKRPLLVDAAGQISQMPCRKLGVVVVGRAPSRRSERDHYSYYSHGESPLDANSHFVERKGVVKV